MLEQIGALQDHHYELLDGDLIDKMGKKRPHISSLAYLVPLMLRFFGIGRVLQESPIDVSQQDNPTNEPEPDVIVLRRPLKDLPGGAIQSADVDLLIEVADTTIRSDLSLKAALYARAGLPEYWVVDLNGRRVIVHRETRDGKYSSIVAYAETESLAPLASADAVLRVADLMG